MKEGKLGKESSWSSGELVAWLIAQTISCAAGRLRARYQELEEEKKKRIDAATDPLSLLKAVKGHLYPYKMSTLEKMYCTVFKLS